MFEIAVARRQIAELSDEALIEMLASEEPDYLPEALRLAREEASSRGLDPEPEADRIRRVAEQRLSRKQAILGYALVFLGFSFLIAPLSAFSNPLLMALDAPSMSWLFVLSMFPAGAALVSKGSSLVSSWQRAVFWSAMAMLVAQGPRHLGLGCDQRLESSSDRLLVLGHRRGRHGCLELQGFQVVISLTGPPNQSLQWTSPARSRGRRH